MRHTDPQRLPAACGQHDPTEPHSREEHMNDLEEEAIQLELDNISKNIDTILNRIETLDPAKQEESPDGDERPMTI